MKFLALAFALLMSSAHAAVEEKTVEYKEGDTVLEGFLAYPKNLKAGEKNPAVVIVHEWDGLGDYVKRRARMVAELGYVAFAADIYGKGVRAKDAAEAGKLAGKYKNDRPLLRARAKAALDYVSGLPEVNADSIGAMGYCFGGTTVLELARSGAPLKSVVSFHGGLSTPMPQNAKNIRSKVLVLHGADDPAVNAEEVAAFHEEMKAAQVDYKFVAYPGAVHAFTNPKNVYKPGAVAGYNKKADLASWAAMKDFFQKTLGR